MSAPPFDDERVREALEAKSENRPSHDRMGPDTALNEVLGQLGALAGETPPPPSLKDRLRRRIAQTPQKKPAPKKAKKRPQPDILAPGIWRFKAENLEWKESGFPGILIKILHLDKQNRRITQLIRMEPGASYPRHRHHAGESFFMLEGELFGAEVKIKAGDYVHSEAGSEHERQWTHDGCMLLLSRGLDDEILEPEASVST